MTFTRDGRPQWLCNWCGYGWTHRDNITPMRCAGCGTRRWDHPRNDEPAGELPSADDE